MVPGLQMMTRLRLPVRYLGHGWTKDHHFWSDPAQNKAGAVFLGLTKAVACRKVRGIDEVYKASENIRL